MTAGETFVVTKHRRLVAKLVPPDTSILLRAMAPSDPGRSNLSALPPRRLKTAKSVDDLIADMRSSW